jgi:Tol biopolymer transport system component
VAVGSERKRLGWVLSGVLSGFLAGVLAPPGGARALTLLVSANTAGARADAGSFEPASDARGRFVAFESDATNLVPGDTNGERDIFVRDRLLGLTNRISVSSSGAQANGDSNGAALDAKGRFVAFHSSADNLVAGDTNGLDDVFVHDRLTGETTRVSVSSAGTQANQGCFTPSLDAKGRFVAFSSSADNLGPGDTNGESDVFVHDRKTGETTRVSLSSTGAEGNGDSQLPALDAKGRFVAFQSLASNLVAGDTNGQRDVFVHDRLTGETTRVSVDGLGAQTNNHSGDPDLDARGRFVAFESSASNLVAGDTNAVSDVFVHDRRTGETRRVSVSNAGDELVDASFDPVLDAKGGAVFFDLDGGLNDVRDVFVHFD